MSRLEQSQPRKPRAAARMRHDFVIQTLPKPRSFSPQPYLYCCVRCGWSFVVNQRRGLVTPLNDDGLPLPEGETRMRAATFAEGPCPALAVLAQEHVGAPAFVITAAAVRLRNHLADEVRALRSATRRIFSRLPAPKRTARERRLRRQPPFARLRQVHLALLKSKAGPPAEN